MGIGRVKRVEMLVCEMTKQLEKMEKMMKVKDRRSTETVVMLVVERKCWTGTRLPVLELARTWLWPPAFLLVVTAEGQREMVY